MSNGFNQNKVFSLVRNAALFAPAAQSFMEGRDPKDKIQIAIERYTGWNMNTAKFNPGKLLEGWGPWIASKIMTQAVPKLVNQLGKIF